MNPTRNLPKNPTVKIAGSEKKANYGSTESLFSFEVDSGKQGIQFMVINKFKSPGNFLPVYKTEAKPVQRGKHIFDLIQIDTDTLCDDNDG